MAEIYDIAVVGAGIAGASAAAECAALGARTILIEAESQPGYHSTGRSAAILAQSYGNPVVRALTRASEDFFTHTPDGFTPRPLLSPRKLIRIARADQMESLRALFEELSVAYDLQWLAPEQIEEIAPILRKGYAAGGFINARAQDIDVHALHHGYLSMFKAHGGVIMLKAAVHNLRPGPPWEISSGGNVLQANTVINAAGAWAENLGALAGARAIGMIPKRRTAITIAAPNGFDPKDLPMIVDADEAFYLKPEAGKLLASPADETASAPCDSQPEEIDIAICIDRIQNAFDLDVRRVESKWAGLRSFVPDRAPVVGFDPDVAGFYWLAAQGGYGVQTAPGLARIAATQILNRAHHPAVQGCGLDLNDISPKRLANLQPA
ncbi:MAG: NAD(P)/FAD-dependent oxidoreductase [Paracoccaceae bacterium]